jgi:hypothetical protein
MNECSMDQDSCLRDAKMVHTCALLGTLTYSECIVCTAEGHRVLYDREVPFEIRNQTDPHDSAQEVRSQVALEAHMQANACIFFILAWTFTCTCHANCF